MMHDASNGDEKQKLNLFLDNERMMVKSDFMTQKEKCKS